MFCSFYVYLFVLLLFQIFMFSINYGIHGLGPLMSFHYPRITYVHAKVHTYPSSQGIQIRPPVKRRNHIWTNSCQGL